MGRYDFVSPGAEASKAIQVLMLQREEMAHRDRLEQQARAERADASKRADADLLLRQGQAAQQAKIQQAALDKQARDEANAQAKVVIDSGQANAPISQGDADTVGSSALYGSMLNRGTLPSKTQVGALPGPQPMDEVPRPDAPPQMPGVMSAPVETAGGVNTLKPTAAQRKQTDEQAAVDDLLKDPKIASDPGVQTALKVFRASGDASGLYGAIAAMTKEPTVKEPPHATVGRDLFEKQPDGSWKMVAQGKSSDGPTSYQTTQRADNSYNRSRTALDKMGAALDAQTTAMGKLAATLRQQTPQADALVAPELLTAMAGGAGTGFRMNEAEIERVVGGRTHLTALKSVLEKLSLNPNTPFLIPPEQRAQISALVQEIGKESFSRLDMLETAGDALLDSEDPSVHRQIVEGARKQLRGAAKAQVLGTKPGAAPAAGRSGATITKIEPLP